MIVRRKLICQWRVSRALPSGLQVWFDPELETIKLYALDPEEARGVADALEGDDSNRDSSDPSSSNNELETLELPF